MQNSRISLWAYISQGAFYGLTRSGALFSKRDNALGKKRILDLLSL